jgi:hypothetical protein
MIRGSIFPRVQRLRIAHGVQSFRAKRTSYCMPFCG